MFFWFQKLHTDVNEIAWPNSAAEAELCLLPGGNIKMVSADEYAAITLAPHQQYFTVEYLAKVSHRASKQRYTPPSKIISLF